MRRFILSTILLTAATACGFANPINSSADAAGAAAAITEAATAATTEATPTEAATASITGGATTSATVAATAAEAEPFSYVPHIHGVIRPRWEISTNSGESHFEIRYARLTLDGAIAPWIDYFFQADFCDRGSLKFLDGYARFTPLKGFSFQAGQFRMPFGVETFRAPQNQYFADRSFMQKTMCNFRRVGAKVAYHLPIRLPLLLEAGAFNNASIADHTKWSKSYCYSGQATLTLGEFKISAGALGVKPENTRMYMYDAALSWENRNFLVHAEYMNENYAHGVQKQAHSYVGFVNYHRPVKSKLINEWSVQGRFDGITENWDGFDGHAISPACNRITIGGTLTYRYKILFADFRLNYAKAFYKNGVTPDNDGGDKVIAEIALRF